MKTSVRVLIRGVIAVVSVIGIVTWTYWPEYGKGYSEDQRRNWNEMISTADEPWDRNSMYSLDEVLGKRRAQDDAPEWEIDFSRPAAILPLEGMTQPGLERLADQGNGDACLELAFRSASMASTAFIFDIYPMEKNVRKAVKSGRAGSDFLVRLLELRKMRGEGFRGRDVDGYVDFLSLIGKGDFMLGKVYVCLIHGDDEVMQRLDAALRKKAGQGDLDALRNAGYLGILRKSESESLSWWGSMAFESTGCQSSTISEKIMKPIKSGMKLLPDFMNLENRKLAKIEQWINKKIESHYWAYFQRSLDTSFDMLLKAAEQGDLHAKFLWAHYVILAQRTLSKDEWEKHLMYVNELIQTGGIYRGNHPQWPDCEFLQLEEYFYQEASVSNLWSAIKEQKEKEYSGFKANPDVPNGIHLLDMKALYDMPSFAEGFVEDVGAFGDHQLNKEEQMHGYRLLEQAASEGSPQAMFALAILLSDGLIVEQDVARSWGFLQKIKIWCDGIKNKNDTGSVSVMLRANASGGMRMYDAIEWLMLDIVSRYGDMPGMTEKEALERIPAFLLYDDILLYDELRDRLKTQFEKRGLKVPSKE